MLGTSVIKELTRSCLGREAFLLQWKKANEFLSDKNGDQKILKNYREIFENIF